MKKRVLLLISIILILSTIMFAFAGCNSTTVVDEKTFAEQEEYYNDIVASVKKCEPILNDLMSAFDKATYSAEFLYERKYYSTSHDNVLFKGTSSVAGYDNNKKTDGTSWMVQAISYVVKAKAGNLYVEAKVHNVVKSDDYNKDKLPAVANTYKLLKKGDTVTVSGGEEAEVLAVCFENIYGAIAKVSETAYLEEYATSADNGFRLYTTMMQYQTTKAYPYLADGKVDTSKTINYKENKGKTMHSACTSTYDSAKNELVFTLEDKTMDMASEDITYWDAYGEDITYNFYKIAEVDNEKVTITYKKSKSRIDSYEYYSERVLPFYTKKDKFNSYFVVKAVVADYSHFIINVEYDDVTVPESL